MKIPDASTRIPCRNFWAGSFVSSSNRSTPFILDSGFLGFFSWLCNWIFCSYLLDFLLLMLRNHRWGTLQLRIQNNSLAEIFLSRFCSDLRILLFRFLYNPFPFHDGNPDIGHLVQTTPALLLVCDRFMVVQTPSVQDWSESEASSDDPWN